MAHCWETGIIGHAVGIEPPAAQHGGHEWGHDASDVDEHIEYLEAGVTLGAVFGVVIQLSDYGLEIAFEEAVAERDEEESHAGERQKP